MEEVRNEKKRLRYSPDQIQEILTAYEASGLSQRKFCQQRGLSLASFGNWRRKYQRTSRREPAAKGFCEVHLKEAAPEAGSLIRLPDGIEVVFPGLLSPDQAAGYVSALRRSC